MKHKAHRAMNRVLAVLCLLMLATLAFAQGSGGSGLDLLTLLKAAVGGLTAALVVDINAWCHSTPAGTANAKFDWGLAVKRWLSGGVTAITTALGWDVVIRL